MPPTRTLLKKTISRCPICKIPCPAEVWKRGDEAASPVYMSRACPEHGEKTVCISSDARFYWISKGNPKNSECDCESEEPSRWALRAGDGSAAGVLGANACCSSADATFETLSTCVALIEIVHSCNLPCPTCYAGSPLGRNGQVDAVPVEDIKQRIEGVIERKGGIEILQLSGGEPTLHPEFFTILNWATAHGKIDYILLNTNGVRLAQDERFVEELGRSFKYGRMQVYLQFDGLQEAGHRALRGGDLRQLKRAAVKACKTINLPLTLAMTVTPENLPHLWRAVEFGLQFPHVRGITFQPMVGSGRIDEGLADSLAKKRLNVADVILGAVEQSAGILKLRDFTPLPCGDPNCATVGYLMKVEGSLRSISEFVNFKDLQGFLNDRIRYRLEDLMKCGCESEPLADLLKQFELDETHTFRLLIKPFMDALTWDQDRIDRCCTHVIRPDGQLDSFCRYYSGFPDGT